LAGADDDPFLQFRAIRIAQLLKCQCVSEIASKAVRLAVRTSPRPRKSFFSFLNTADNLDKPGFELLVMPLGCRLVTDPFHATGGPTMVVTMTGLVATVATVSTLITMLALQPTS